MIPEHIVSQILDTAQIEEVIRDFVNIKKRGANYIANCPFHNEKTPSFSISPSKGIFKCFGCGIAGNSAKFVMEHEKINYPDALRHLAKKYNIEVPEPNISQKQTAKYQYSQSLHILNQMIADYFRDYMIKEKAGQDIGLSYFEERGFTKETIQMFQLGYAPSDRQALVRYAKEKQLSLKSMETAGLIRGSGNKYPFFFDRVMFPIFNVSGKIVAFGGRTLGTSKKVAKYLNSPENEIYNKSKIVYGLNFSRHEIRKLDRCIVLEGYTDVISLFQNAIKNVVAACGTSLTTQHLQQIKRYTKNLLLLFDADKAGIKAALRTINLALQEDMNIDICLLPKGEDPDSYVRSNGRPALISYIDAHKMNFLKFYKYVFAYHKIDVTKKDSALKRIFKSISHISEPIKRSLFIKESSNLFAITEQLIIDTVNAYRGESIVVQQKNEPQKDIALPVFKQQVSRKVTIEKALIKIMLHALQSDTETQETFITGIINSIDNIPKSNTVYGEILDIYFRSIEDEFIVSSEYFMTQERDEVGKAVMDLLIEPYHISENWEQMHQIYNKCWEDNIKKEMNDLIANYMILQVQTMEQELLDELKTCTDQTYLEDLLHTHKFLQEQKQEIRTNFHNRWTYQI